MRNIWGMFPALAIAPHCYDISLYYYGHFHLVLSSLQGQGPGSGSVWQNLCYITCNLTDSFFPDCESFTFMLRKPFYQIFRQMTKARLRHPYLDLWSILLKENLVLSLLSLNSTMPEWTKWFATANAYLSIPFLLLVLINHIWML